MKPFKYLGRVTVKAFGDCVFLGDVAANTVTDLKDRARRIANNAGYVRRKIDIEFIYSVEPYRGTITKTITIIS